MKEKIKTIAREISGLNSCELSELSEILLQEHNISATIYNFGSKTETKLEDNYYKLVLRKTGYSKLSLVKEIKELFGLGLKDAKDIVDSVPCYLSESIEYTNALKIKMKLENIGAEVEIL